MTTIYGGSGDDTLSGANKADVISGGGGDDVIEGGNGSDTLSGGSGDDTLNGGSGNDKLSGGSGNDTLNGGSGNDKLSGGSGNDTLSGGSGNDELEGGSGNDMLFGGSGNDELEGGSGDDMLFGGSGNDELEGGSGDDTLYGGSGKDELEGGSGNDILIGGTGADWLAGGSGKDVFAYLSESDSNTCAWDRIIDFAQGGDKIDLSALLGQTNLAWGNQSAMANGAWYQNSGSSIFVYADVTGNGQADLKIELKYTCGLNLTVNDFIGVSEGNNSPVIMAEDLSGAVTELVTPVGNLTDSGTIAFTDVDLTDIHSVSAVAPSLGALGSLTASVSTDTTGSGLGGVVTWNYSVAAADAEFLAKDQHQIQTFTFDVLDGQGGSVSRTVSVDITGTNDAPVITSGVQSGSATEIADLASDENATLHTATGAVSFTDADTLDTHSATFAPQAGSYLGAFALDPADSPAVMGNAVGWTFEVDDSVLDSLQAGQVLTQNYDVTVSDGHGGTAMQTVTLTLTGTNDAPLVADTDVSGAVTELLVTPVGNLPDSGTIAFTDVDLTDSHSVSPVMSSAGALGSLTASVSTDTTGSGLGGVVTWNYSVAAADVEFLAEGQDKIETFAFDVQDGQGGSVSRTVNVTITGTNDAPTSLTFTGGTVAEQAAFGTVVGSVVSVSDVDAGDTFTFSLTNDAGGRFTINSSTGVIAVLDGGQLVADSSHTVTVRVTDFGDLFHDQDFIIAVAGNNPPVAVADTVITNVEGGSVNIPEWALLANDSDQDGNSIDVQIGSVIGAGHIPGEGTNGFVSLSLSSDTGGSFTYLATDGLELSGSAMVNVTQDLSGSTLTGNDGNDIIVGNDTDPSTMVGNNGNDILVGGLRGDTLRGNNGNDTLAGGGGNDVLSGGSDSDLFDYNALSDADFGTAGDTITDFEKGLDDLDLHDLLATFSGYTTETAFSGGYLNFAASGSNTLVQVDSDGSANSDGGNDSSFVTLATITGVTLTSGDTGDFML